MFSRLQKFRVAPLDMKRIPKGIDKSENKNRVCEILELNQTGLGATKGRDAILNIMEGEVVGSSPIGRV